MEYRIVQVDCGPVTARDAAKAASELAALVNAQIAEGWVPVGGLASVSVGAGIYLLQAMTRERVNS
jgi:hypothetical protein